MPAGCSAAPRGEPERDVGRMACGGNDTARFMVTDRFAHDAFAIEAL
jgi:hypothetical protein